jgi:hypothetical protein
VTATRYTPSTTIFRVAYREPASLPAWKYVGGGRFDDPQQTYRVLYTSLTPIGACIEKFQDLRPSPEVTQAEAEFEFDGSLEIAAAEVPTGVLLFDRHAVLYLAELTIPHDASLLDLTVDESARYFAEVFGQDLTVSDLIADRTYEYTQPISRLGFTDQRGLAGIYSASKIDPVVTQNVTLYEGDSEQLRIPIRAEHVESISETTAPFVEACRQLGITIETADQFHARTIRARGV